MLPWHMFYKYCFTCFVYSHLLKSVFRSCSFSIWAGFINSNHREFWPWLLLEFHLILWISLFCSCDVLSFWSLQVAPLIFVSHQTLPCRLWCEPWVISMLECKLSLSFLDGVTKGLVWFTCVCVCAVARVRWDLFAFVACIQRCRNQNI